MILCFFAIVKSVLSTAYPLDIRCCLTAHSRIDKMAEKGWDG